MCLFIYLLRCLTKYLKIGSTRHQKTQEYIVNLNFVHCFFDSNEQQQEQHYPCFIIEIKSSFIKTHIII